MGHSRYTHIIFDAGGTLLGTNTDSEHWYEQFFIERFAEHGCHVTPGDVRMALTRAARSFPENSRCSSDAQTRRFWEHVYGEAFVQALCPGGLPGAEARALARHYIDRFESGEYVQLFSGTSRLLSALSDNGHKIGLISNYASYLRRFLSQLEIADFFDFIIISAEQGCEKPDAALFEVGLRHCNGAAPGDILYIGDNLEEDYRPACALGMDALLIDRYGKYPDEATINKITHLDAVLNHL